MFFSEDGKPRKLIDSRDLSPNGKTLENLHATTTVILSSLAVSLLRQQGVDKDKFIADFKEVADHLAFQDSDKVIPKHIESITRLMERYG